MILGEFNSRGELIFEIGLVTADGEIIPVQALLDTGFTGWLDEEELIIPVLGGNELQDILLGVHWLQSKQLVADFTARVLTLG